MIVIADTTPLISLMKIEKLVLLNKLFGEVQIPEAVFQELTANASFKKEAQEIKSCEFIQVVEVTNKTMVSVLRRATGLDVGESEAMILTDEQQGDLLLIDEVKGRKVAKQMGIRIMGTMGILMLALEKGAINFSETVQSIEILKDSGRHIKNELYEALLNAAEKYR
ncbi:MAG: DUF3368 domain-containing protein [Eubacterium sp.]|nr:DUF3368 domain-containing protein [Eubacterium sp.]